MIFFKYHWLNLLLLVIKRKFFFEYHIWPISVTFIHLFLHFYLFIFSILTFFETQMLASEGSRLTHYYPHYLRARICKEAGAMWGNKLNYNFFPLTVNLKNNEFEEIFFFTYGCCPPTCTLASPKSEKSTTFKINEWALSNWSVNGF